MLSIVDYETDVLYWTDMKLHLIVGVNVGPNGPKDRKIVLTSFTFLRHPFSVTVFEVGISVVIFSLNRTYC